MLVVAVVVPMGSIFSIPANRNEKCVSSLIIRALPIEGC